MTVRQMFTFGFVYPGGGEELDVWAETETEARRVALLLAAEELAPGWTEVVLLPAGGSGGLIRGL